MRIYAPVGVEELQTLAGGGAVTVLTYVPASDDEEDELAALEEASENGPAVAAAEVTDPDGPVTIEQVASFHVDLDGTGDLAWFATQEIGEVLRVVQGTPPT